ncbi:MAG: hypothetical protein ABIJ08_01295, partial [Nanoarchaeota archaeon]
RYKIGTPINTYCGVYSCTEIPLSRPLNINLDPTTVVHVYTEPIPDGYFTQEVQLTEGQNIIFIHASDINNNPATSQERYIEYSELSLNLQITTPEFNRKFESDFLLTNSVTIEATTDIPADCHLTHPGNAVAKPFDLILAPDVSKTTHIITLDSDYCASEGGALGKFCYLNNDENTQDGVFHNYTVTCASTQGGLSDSAPICFNIWTWYDMGGNEDNKNICDGSTGCTGLFPTSCGAAACTDECTLGQTGCSVGNTQRWTCIQSDCLTKQYASCTTGQECVLPGICQDITTDQCADGEKRCVGSQIQICDADLNPNQWADPEDCDTPGYTCSNDECQSATGGAVFIPE